MATSSYSFMPGLADRITARCMSALMEQALCISSSSILFFYFALADHCFDEWNRNILIDARNCGIQPGCKSDLIFRAVRRKDKNGLSIFLCLLQ